MIIAWNSIEGTNSKITVTHTRPIRLIAISFPENIYLGSYNVIVAVSNCHFRRTIFVLLGAKYFTNSRTVQPIYICGCSDSIENNLIFIVSPYAHCSALLYFPAIHLVAGADVVERSCLAKKHQPIFETSSCAVVSCRAQFWHNEVDAEYTQNTFNTDPLKLGATFSHELLIKSNQFFSGVSIMCLDKAHHWNN